MDGLAGNDGCLEVHQQHPRVKSLPAKTVHFKQSRSCYKHGGPEGSIQSQSAEAETGRIPRDVQDMLEESSTNAAAELLEINSPKAAARAIMKVQARMDERNLQLSQERPTDIDWQQLKSIPGDPKHLDTKSRLRVAVLSQSLLPCALRGQCDGWKCNRVATYY